METIELRYEEISYEDLSEDYFHTILNMSNENDDYSSDLDLFEFLLFSK